MNEYKHSLERLSENEEKDLRTFLEEKGFDWNETLKGKVEEISTKTFDHLVDDIKNDRGKRKSWFRIKSAIAMKNYEKNNKWSNLEIQMRNILESLDLRLNEDFFHNFKLNNKEQNGYFALDFLLPDFKRVIECDGSVWHDSLGDEVKKKDARRDKWLERLGFETIRFDDEEMREPELIRERLRGELFDEPS